MLLRKSREMKRRVGRSFTWGKKKSANTCTSKALSCTSNHVFLQYSTPLLQLRRAVLHVDQVLWSSRIQFVITFKKVVGGFLGELKPHVRPVVPEIFHYVSKERQLTSTWIIPQFQVDIYIMNIYECHKLKTCTKLLGPLIYQELLP